MAGARLAGGAHDHFTRNRALEEVPQIEDLKESGNPGPSRLAPESHAAEPCLQYLALPY